MTNIVSLSDSYKNCDKGVEEDFLPLYGCSGSQPRMQCLLASLEVNVSIDPCVVFADIKTGAILFSFYLLG